MGLSICLILQIARKAGDGRSVPASRDLDLDSRSGGWEGSPQMFDCVQRIQGFFGLLFCLSGTSHYFSIGSLLLVVDQVSEFGMECGEH